LRISLDAGYRAYYTKHKNEIIILLVGPDKSTQISDIKRAKTMVKEYKDE
jgi:putative addiction module killer protein